MVGKAAEAKCLNYRSVHSRLARQESLDDHSIVAVMRPIYGRSALRLGDPHIRVIIAPLRKWTATPRGPFNPAVSKIRFFLPAAATSKGTGVLSI